MFQPFGNQAFRADLLSAVLVAGAAALAAVATVQLTRRAVLGLLAGVAFAVVPVAWPVGVRADAHALHVFLVALVLVLLIEWRRRERVASGDELPDPAGQSAGPDSGSWRRRSSSASRSATTR